MRRLRGLIICWLILSAPLLGFTGLGDGAFLCWGDDGHIVIETELCEPGCAVVSSDPHHDGHNNHDDHGDHDDHCEPGGCASDESCGVCIDIPLPQSGALNRVLRSSTQKLSGAKVPVMAIICNVESQVSANSALLVYSSSLPPGAPDQLLASLRTVILLS
jgi:hypothetical protein